MNFQRLMLPKLENLKPQPYNSQGSGGPSPLPFPALIGTHCGVTRPYVLALVRIEPPTFKTTVPLLTRLTFVLSQRARTCRSRGVRENRESDSSGPTGSGQPRTLFLPCRAGSSTGALPPGCCGFIGPVPSATLDKRRGSAANAKLPRKRNFALRRVRLFLEIKRFSFLVN
jgi:hypothetical protein